MSNDPAFGKGNFDSFLAREGAELGRLAWSGLVFREAVGVEKPLEDRKGWIETLDRIETPCLLIDLGSYVTACVFR